MSAYRRCIAAALPRPSCEDHATAPEGHEGRGSQRMWNELHAPGQKYVDGTGARCGSTVRMFRFVCVAACAAMTLLVLPARAIVIGGGGSSHSDCLVVFDAAVNFPADAPKRFRCADGDPCDADGVVNGVCAFDVTVCANSTYAPAQCGLVGVDSIAVDHAVDNGDPKFDPDLQALQNRIDNGIVGPGDPPNTDPDRCALPSRFLVPVVGPLAGNLCKRGKKQLKMTSYGVPMLGVATRDRDKLKMECEPAAAGCDPQVIYAGTFDRIQRQIFDQTCAVSGCHDSQSQTGELLLEQGAAYGNLIDVTPQSPGAAAAGWKRVDATNASSASSFLFHKLTGDLDGTQGARMPFGRGALDDYLVEIVRLWIEAGAPATGWVPDTY